MLADLRPMLTDTVHHWLEPVFDVFGKASDNRGYTEHPARVVYSPGVELGPASKQRMPVAAATIWLFDHPRPLAIGDTFKLIGSGEVLKVVRIERRAVAGAVLSKVYVK